MTQIDYLKYQLKNAPLKLLISILLAMYFAFKSTQGSDTVPGSSLLIICLYGLTSYGLMSCLSGFAKALHNWFLGIILFIIVTAIISSDVLPQGVNGVVAIVLLFWGIVRDLYRFIKLLRLMRAEKTGASLGGWVQNAAVTGSSDEINSVIEEYNYSSGIVQSNFDNMEILLKEKPGDPSEFQQLVKEFNKIASTAKAVSMKLQKSDQLSQEELYVLQASLSQCCSSMRSLKDKQTAYMSDLAKMGNKQTNTTYSSGSSTTGSEYFAGCDTRESLSKRYRDLCKVYHPDMGNGSSEIFNKIQIEYDALKTQFE
jgi:hypothetical protein